MQPNCQIYLNDRCIICKSGYKLLNNHNCSVECDSSTYTTSLIQSHNQCQRQCHPTCATCNLNNPSICLTCYGLRTSPPNCYCPNNYFEDKVSPNCRKYYPDTSIQTGTVSFQCSTYNYYYCCQSIKIYFGYTFKTTPTVILSLVGTSTIYNMPSFRAHYFSLSEVSNSSLTIYFQCNLLNQLYVINWVSSVANNILQSNYLEQDTSNSAQHTYIQSKLNLNGIQLNQIHQINGWEYFYGSTKQVIQQSQPNSTSISFNASPNIFDYLWRNYFYTQFKTYDISNVTFDTQLDDQPKSIQSIIIQRGFSIDSYYRFIYQPNKRNSSYFSIKSVFNKSMQIYDWLVIMASQQCNNNSGPCDFYESYILNCNKQFSFCNENTTNQRYFLNQSSYNYQRNNINIILVCDDSCKTCEGNSSNCTSCFTEQNMTLKNNRCLYNCDPNCLECSPILNTTCTKCVPFATLNQADNKCYCDDGYYFDSFSYLCLECSKQCLTCHQNPNNCTACSELAFLNGTKCIILDGYYFDENYTIFKCASNCKNCKSNIKCTSCIHSQLIFGTGQCYCPSGYYFDELLQCSPCMKHCLDCRNIDSCLQCSSDKILSNDTCICDFNKYIDSDEICQNCNIKCRTCNGPSENQCLTCNFDRQKADYNQCECIVGYYDIQDKQECQQCPVNCLQCISQSQCTLCGPNLTLNNGVCECSQEFYMQDDKCQSCDTKLGKYILECNYRNCYDKIYTPSEECDDGNLVNYDGCSNCKIDQNYQCYNQVDKVSICFQCQNQCNSCELKNSQIICEKCNDGYFLSDNQCQLCSKNCKTCLTYNQCLECPILSTQPDEQFLCPECDIGYYLQIDQCVALCGDGIKTDDEQCDDGNTNQADGCDNNCKIEESYVCKITSHKSLCFRSYKPKLILNELIKITNSQYKIQISSDQMVQFSKFDVQVSLLNDTQYTYTFDVQYTQKNKQYNKQEINITINFSVSTRQLIFLIKIGGDIYNQYGQTLDEQVFTQYFQNIYILEPSQAQSSQLLSDLGGKLFYVTLSLSILQLFLSETTDSVSLMMKTQNYLQYLRYINIDYPPNIIQIFNQFADSNVLQFLDFPSIVGRLFSINLSINQFYISTPSFYNNQQVNKSFFANIYLFVYTLIQSILLIEFLIYIVKKIQLSIVYQIISKKTFDTKLIKLLSFGQFHLIKTIFSFKQNGIQKLFSVAQYNIYFALFIQIKNFQFDTIFDIIELSSTFISFIICGIYVFDQSKRQSATTIIGNINAISFIFCIVFLLDFQLQQLIIISTQSIILLVVLIQEGKFMQNIQGIVEELSIILTFLSSIFYIYNPFEIDQIFIGFFQFGAILSTFVVNVFLQLGGLYCKFIKYNVQLSKKVSKKI